MKKMEKSELGPSHYFNSATKEILLMELFYWVSWPFAKILAKAEVHPNTITTMSNVLAMISFILLFKNFWLFSLVWILAEVFDMCDGTVARLTQKTSLLGAFYDQTSDKFKLGIYFILLGIKFDQTEIWIYTATALLFFFVYMALNGELDAFKAKTNFKNDVEIIQHSHQEKNLNLFSRVKNSFLMIHGNFPFLVIPAAYNDLFAKITLISISVICLRSVLLVLRERIQLSREPKINF